MNGRYHALDDTTAAALAVPLREDPSTSTQPRSDFDDKFVAQFEEHFQRVRRVIGRLSGDFELADDIAQDTFVRLYGRGTLPDFPGQWLITVALNLFRNSATTRVRRARLLTVARGEAVHSDPSPAPDHASNAGESQQRVRAAMSRLPEREQRLLLLHADAYSYREIASTLGIHDASVGTLLARAKRQFLQAYGDPNHAR